MLLVVPRFLALVLLFISVILLSFLLLGCVELSASYSNVNLAAVRSKSATLLLGYLNACYRDDSLVCATYPKLSTIVSDKELVKWAEKFSETCLSYVLIVTICLTLVWLAVHAYTLVPILPAKMAAKRVCLAIAVCTVLLWGLGAMLQDKLVGTAVALSLSFSEIKVSAGKRAQIMTWTAFAMLVVAGACCGWETFTARREVKAEGPAAKIEKQKAFYYV